MIFYLPSSLLLMIFILCSHVFGTTLDLNDSDVSQIPAADDIEDEYDTIRRQRSAKRARLQAST